MKTNRPEPYQHPTIRTGEKTEPFFDLSQPDHAYLFGLLQTDGSHTTGTRNRGRITLELKSGDGDLLHKIRDLVPWYSNVHTRTRETNFSDSATNVVWTLCSHDARQELTRLGLPPGPKSRNCQPPQASHLAKTAYLRGLIDGDGSLGFTGQGYPFIGFSTASEAMIRYVEQEFHRLSGASRHTNRNSRDDQFNVIYMNDPAATIAAALYEGARLALERKRVASSKVSKWERPAQMRARSKYPVRRWTSREDELAVSGRPVDEIARLVGRSERAVKMRRWRLRQ